mmetsp:Transcript_32055/g.89741  ORF Transcript_32055/g.89741 Transcript_32055/m.89741 type:complete len:126 (-) Transcript_32055:431-808(-)
MQRIAGVRKDLLVEAHGSFATASCVECSEKHTHEFVREKVFVDELPHCTKCQKGLVKPDIVFFGEALPQRFHMLASSDFEKADLLIVMGTSLQVQVFHTSSIPRGRTSLATRRSCGVCLIERSML